MIWMARSASDQWEKGKPKSAGVVVAKTMTLCRSSGGKSPRSTAAREVCQAREALGGEALSPLADRGGVAGELLGYLLVGGTVGLPAAQDKSATKGLRLRRRMGVDDLLQL